MQDNFKKAYLKSFSLRVVLNILCLIVLYVAMNDILSILPTYKTNLGNINPKMAPEVINTASYIFDETSILITQSGLMVVALMALLFGLEHFKIKSGEDHDSFRRRLLIYTLAHLGACLVMSTYLMVSVGLMVFPESLRLNTDNSFIWTYPSYTVLVVIYLVELYKFYTEND